VKPRFFKTPSALRAWFTEHHERATELHVGFYKRGFGKPSITWPESVDEALCVGWIDGVRRSIDEVSYTIRFTPRKKRSIWSAVNIRRAEELDKRGAMRPAGLRAFAAREENRSGIYAYEQRTEQLPDPYAALFKKDRAAWTFYQTMPPWYRKTTGWWIVGAKKEETRLTRLATLREHCRAKRILPQYERYQGRKK